MGVQVKSRFYLFHNPFFVSRQDRHLPAGNYCVETYEQVVQGEKFLTYLPVLTLLHLNNTADTSASDGMILVDLAELELAFTVDQAEAVGWDFLEDDLSEQEERLIGALCRTKMRASTRSPFVAMLH